MPPAMEHQQHEEEEEEETKWSLSRCIEMLPQETVDLHKEILLGLFLHCSSQELSYLAHKTGTMTLKGLVSSSHGTSSSEVNLQRYTPCSLTLVPEVLQQITNKKQEEESRNKKLIPTAPHWKARKDYCAFPTLEELEKHVSTKFDSYISMQQPHRPNVKKNVNNTMPVSPISILYNECSFAAFSRWAAAAEYTNNGNTANPIDDTQVTYYYPTSSSLFRKCLICHKYGHYELECEEMNEMSLLKTIDPHLRAQLMVNEFAPTQDTTDSSLDPSPAVCVANLVKGEPFLSATQVNPIATSTKRRRISNGKNGPSADPQETRYPKRTLHTTKDKCSICHSSLRQQDILSCNGCNTSFHYQCLDDLGGLGSGAGEWFCEACLSYESDVSSVVDLEPCDGFVIEQRKKSVSKQQDFGNTTLGFHDTGWSCAISVFMPEQPTSAIGTTSQPSPPQYNHNNSSNNNNSDIAKHQQPYGNWDDAVVDELEGIQIYSKPLEAHYSETVSTLPLFLSTRDTGKQAAISKLSVNTNTSTAAKHPFEDIIWHNARPEELIGALVTWSIPLDDTVGEYQNDNGNSSANRMDVKGSLTDSATTTNMIGSVVTLDQFNTFALVRLLPDSCEVITALGNHIRRNNSQSALATCHTAVGSCNLGASIWVPVKSLSLIQRVPDAKIKEKAQINLMNALQSELMNRKKRSTSSSHNKETPKQEQQKHASAALSTGESLPKGDPVLESDKAGVAQAERIIDERINDDTLAKEYLTKWKGRGVKDSSWELEKNINAPHLIQIFTMEQLIKDLGETPQAYDCSSVTSKVIKALTEGRKQLISLADSSSSSSSGRGSTIQKVEKPVGRICPFCERGCVNIIGLSTHLKTHEEEPNYKAIREACKLGFE